MEHVLILQNDTHRKTATAAQVYKLQCSPLIMTCAPSVTWQIWPVNEFTLASLTTIGKLWQTTSNHPHSMSFSALKGWLPAVAFVPMPPSLQLWQLLALQTAWARELTVSKLFPSRSAWRSAFNRGWKNIKTVRRRPESSSQVLASAWGDWGDELLLQFL